MRRWALVSSEAWVLEREEWTVPLAVDWFVEEGIDDVQVERTCLVERGDGGPGQKREHAQVVCHAEDDFWRAFVKAKSTRVPKLTMHRFETACVGLAGAGSRFSSLELELAMRPKEYPQSSQTVHRDLAASIGLYVVLGQISRDHFHPLQVFGVFLIVLLTSECRSLYML
jgi:hypothetical protein